MTAVERVDPGYGCGPCSDPRWCWDVGHCRLAAEASRVHTMEQTRRLRELEQAARVAGDSSEQ